MRQLQLHEIAAYLPYGLKLQYHNDRIGILTSLLDIIDYDDIKLKIGYSDAEHIWMFKPILRQMSDLTQDELYQIVDFLFKDSQMIRPQKGSSIFSNGFLTFYDLCTMQTYVAVKPSMEGTPVLNMSNTFNDYSIFFKLHVDMFNLIPDGLAIDKNTLNQEKP